VLYTRPTGELTALPRTSCWNLEDPSSKKRDREWEMGKKCKGSKRKKKRKRYGRKGKGRKRKR